MLCKNLVYCKYVRAVESRLWVQELSILQVCAGSRKQACGCKNLVLCKCARAVGSGLWVQELSTLQVCAGSRKRVVGART